MPRSSRFDDFGDFSRDQSGEAPSGRAARRTAVRRGSFRLRWPEATWARWAVGVAGVVLLAGIGFGVYEVRSFFLHDARFTVAASDDIRVTGNQQVTEDDIHAVFAEDIGRNIFHVPLAERRAQLEALPWVHHATVERLLPDRIAVAISERVPSAFVQNNGSVELVDSDGVVLDMPASLASKYSFPVVTGVGSDVPQTTRVARMAVYDEFIRQVDSGGANVSARISEIDLTDPEDVIATIPEDGVPLTVHFGDADYLGRYKTYQAHLGEWRQQYSNLATVDLRNAPQVTLGMSKKTSPIADAAPVSVPAPVPDAASAEKAEAAVPEPVRNDSRESSDAASASPAPVAARQVALVAKNSAARSSSPKPVNARKLAPPKKPAVVTAKLVKPAAPRPLPPPAVAHGKTSPAVRMNPSAQTNSDALATFRSAAPQPVPQHKMVLHMSPQQSSGAQAGEQ